MELLELKSRLRLYLVQKGVLWLFRKQIFCALGKHSHCFVRLSPLLAVFEVRNYLQEFFRGQLTSLNKICIVLIKIHIFVFLKHGFMMNEFLARGELIFFNQVSIELVLPATFDRFKRMFAEDADERLLGVRDFL